MKDLGKEVDRESFSRGIFSGNGYMDYATVSVPSVCNISAAYPHLCIELIISCDEVVCLLIRKGRMPKESSATSAVFSA